MWQFLPFHVNLTYLFSAEVTPLTKMAFFTMFSRFVRKWTEISKILLKTDIRKVVMGFPTTPKWAPQLDPFPQFGGSKTWKNAKNGFYHFQMIKLCGEVFPSKNFPRQSCLHICLTTSVKKFSKSVHNYTFYTDFSDPLDWRKCAYFKRLYFLNGCIDLDVRYTDRKDMTRSTS